MQSTTKNIMEEEEKKKYLVITKAEEILMDCKNEGVDGWRRKSQTTFARSFISSS